MESDRIVDTSSGREIGQELLGYLSDAGYSSEEILGGLVWAIKAVARGTKNEEQVRDEVVALLD